MSFGDCAQAAIRFASEGLPMYGLMAGRCPAFNADVPWAALRAGPRAAG